MLKHYGYPVDAEYNDFFNDPSYKKAEKIADTFIDDFINKVYDKVIVVYNEFINAVVQEVRAEQLLPLELPVSNAADSYIYNYIYEPDIYSILRSIIPEALKTLFFKMLIDSIASEHGARMTSMHKATDNAQDMKDELTLQYNKARQSVITGEILEIVSGAEALKG